MYVTHSNTHTHSLSLSLSQVNITDGSLLPVRPAAYWKCTELITNFRFDYTYITANLPPSTGLTRPPITQMTVCVPVNGGVRNTLSRPSGNWMADKQQIMWKIGEVQASDNESEHTHAHTHTHTHAYPPSQPTDTTSIHAKFDVTEGPSLPQPAEVKFVCDGSTLSGIELELLGTDYRVSLLKRKFSSGTNTHTHTHTHTWNSIYSSE